MKKEDLISIMMDGFEPIENYFKAHPLPEDQKYFIRNLVEGISSYKAYMELTGGVLNPVPDEFPSTRPEPVKLTARGQCRLEKDGGSYLSQNEVDDFQKEGLLGPFKVISPEEAEEIRQYSVALHETNFEGNVIASPEHIKSLSDAGLWSISFSGFYQASFYKPIRDVLSNDNITHRIASLMGDDLICWRSQYFGKDKGEPGTFWHQTDTFQEVSLKPKLTPTKASTANMANLTCWVALTDVNKDNGCMRFLPGSYVDNRLEVFSYFVKKNPIHYLYKYDEEELESMISTLLFAGVLEKSQVLYNMAMEFCDDLFSGIQPRDMEMQAGEAIIFSSMNVHGAYANITDSSRLALVGRYTNNDVKVMDGWEVDLLPSPYGDVEYSLDRTTSFQVHGTDKYHWNKMLAD